MTRVAVGASSFASVNNEALDLLLGNEIEVIKNPYGRKLSESETIEHLRDADGLLAGLEPLTEHVFSSSPQLKAIARIGIGMDNVDIPSAERRGIKVSNTPDGPTEAVAEMTLAALLAITRRLIPSNNDVHKGLWNKHMGKSIRELCVFIVGYGRTGRRVGELLTMFGAEIMTYDKFNATACNCSFEEGLRKADVITFHASGTDTIIMSKEMGMMKNGVILLNSARGSLIDEDELYKALKSGKVSWFWGDAFWKEPYTGKIRGLSNALLTPHACTYTTMCREEMEMQAVKNLLRDLGYVV